MSLTVTRYCSETEPIQAVPAKSELYQDLRSSLMDIQGFRNTDSRRQKDNSYKYTEKFGIFN